MTDYYQILGVCRSATNGEIKAAYRALVKLWHPDVNADGAAKFNQITEANAVLSDPKKRKEYDAKLSAGTKKDSKKGQGYAAQKAKFDISVTEFLDRLPPKERKTAKSLLDTAERLSAVKAQAQLGKIIAQINADAEAKIAEAKDALYRQSKKK